MRTPKTSKREQGKKGNGKERKGKEQEEDIYEKKYVSSVPLPIFKTDSLVGFAIEFYEFFINFEC